MEEKLSDCQIILVSNREPYMHIYRGGEVEVIMPASGMAIALDSHDADLRRHLDRRRQRRGRSRGRRRARTW